MFYLHFAPSLPQTRHYPILFAPFFFSNHPYFIATPPPIRLLFGLLHLNILPYINKKLLHFNFILPHLEHGSNLFNLHSHPFFLSQSPPFPLVYSHLNPNQNYFSTPPQSLCNKGMATLSCNSYDIAPQKQCNCHLKALLLERKSYSFAPQRLCPQPTKA